MFFVYVLENEMKGRYIGYTSDLKRRLKDHNTHQNVSTAKSNLWKLIYFEMYLDKMDAIGREKFLKSGSGWKFLKKQLSHYLSATNSQLS